MSLKTKPTKLLYLQPYCNYTFIYAFYYLYFKNIINDKLFIFYSKLLDNI